METLLNSKLSDGAIVELWRIKGKYSVIVWMGNMLQTSLSFVSDSYVAAQQHYLKV